jgi:hypothetical protein
VTENGGAESGHFPLLDIHMDADVPVFTAIVDVQPDPLDDDGGMTAATLDDFGIAIPEAFALRFDDWYRQLPVWQDVQPNMEPINRTGRGLAEELGGIIGQPVAYNLPYVRPPSGGRCGCSVHGPVNFGVASE